MSWSTLHQRSTFGKSSTHWRHRQQRRLLIESTMQSRDENLRMGNELSQFGKTFLMISWGTSHSKPRRRAKVGPSICWRIRSRWSTKSEADIQNERYVSMMRSSTHISWDLKVSMKYMDQSFPMIGVSELSWMERKTLIRTMMSLSRKHQVSSIDLSWIQLLPLCSRDHQTTSYPNSTETWVTIRRTFDSKTCQTSSMESLPLIYKLTYITFFFVSSCLDIRANSYDVSIVNVDCYSETNIC